jgi:hypothetical protein
MTKRTYGICRPRGQRGLNRFNMTEEIRHDRVQTELCRTIGTDKNMQKITMRTSGIILDRAKSLGNTGS